MSELTEALAKPKALVWQGREVEVEPFDLNDLSDIEAEIGDVFLLDPTRLEHQRLILWLAFRRIDPDLTPEQKDRLEYKMTLAQAGRMLNLKQMRTPEALEFMEGVLRLSGILPESEQQGNAEAAEAAAEAPAVGKTRRKASAA